MSEIQPNTRNNLADINTAFAVTPGMSEFERRLYRQAAADDDLLSDNAAEINNGLDQLLNAIMAKIINAAQINLLLLSSV